MKPLEGPPAEHPAPARVHSRPHFILRIIVAISLFGWGSGLLAYNEKSTRAFSEVLQRMASQTAQRLEPGKAEELHRHFTSVFAAEPLATWLAASPIERLATELDFERAVTLAQQKGNLDRALRVAIQGVLRQPADPHFPTRLGRAAALLELQERTLGRAAEQALADALYGTMEKFPSDDMVHQAGKLMRAAHHALRREFARARTLADEVRALPELTSALRAPAVAIAAATAEAVGDFPAAAAGYEEFARHEAMSAPACSVLLRAIFLHLHQGRTADALRLVGQLEKANAATVARANGAEQIQRFIALKQSGHAEAYWQRWQAWWPAWEALSRAAAVPEAASETIAPVIASPATLAAAIDEANKLKDRTRFFQELRPAVSAARWLPSHVALVTAFPLSQLPPNREVTALHRDFLHALLQPAQDELGDAREHRARQRAFAAVLIEKHEPKQALALVADLRRRTPAGQEAAILHRVWAAAADRTATEREEAAAALEADLEKSDHLTQRGYTVAALATLYRALLRFDEERALLARELARPELLADAPAAKNVLVTRQHQLARTSKDLEPSVAKNVPPLKRFAAPKSILPGGRTASRSAEMDSPFDPAAVDSVPRALRQMPPAYSEDLIARGLAGTVVVEFIVDATGTVVSARAVSSPHDELAAIAVAAVSKWEFEPARKNGRPVKAHLQVPLTFGLTAPTAK